MNDLPASLIERIKSRQAVLVAGVDCSRMAGRPGWDELGLRLTDWLENEPERDQVRALIAAGRVATAIAFLRSRLSDEVVLEVLKDSYSLEAKASDDLALIARIPWRGVITTGFDDLWDRLLAAGADVPGVSSSAPAPAAASPTTTFLPRDAQALEKHRGRFLLHLCGSLDAPESICLSPADVRAKVTPTGIIEIVDDLHQRWSFVFLGFGLQDPDLKLVSQRLLGANINRVEHFLIYPGEAGFEAELMRAEQGLTPVPVGETVEQAVKALGDAWNVVAAEARPPEEDIESWLEIWARDPGDEESRAVLRRGEDRLRAGKDWERLVELLLNQVQRLPSRADQVAMLREVGRVLEADMDASQRAFAAMSTAFSLDCEAPGLKDEVLRLAGKSGSWNELAAEYAEIVKEISDPLVRARHGLELARIYAEELNQYEPAVTAYQQVRAIQPARQEARGQTGVEIGGETGAAAGTATGGVADDANRETGGDAGAGRQPNDSLAVRVAAREETAAWAEIRSRAFEAVVDLLGKQDRWADLATVLAEGADDKGDPAREIKLRLQLGELQASRLGDVDAALATYERLRELDPASIKIQEALEPLYRQKERWLDVSHLLAEKAKRTSDPEELARVRAARADMLERAGDVEASITALEAVVANNPSNRAALRSLEKLYDKQGRDDDYLRTLERLCEVADDGPEKLLLLRRLAAEWDERPDGIDRAAEALEQILQIDPTDDDAFRALGRVYRQSRRWLPLVEALTRKIAASSDPGVVRDLYVSLGKLHEEETMDLGRAIAAYADAVRAGDEREPTLRALARLYEQRGRWREAAETLEHVARAARDPADRAVALTQAGGIYAGHLDDRDAAEDRYARALELAPHDVGGLEALGTLYRNKGEFLRATRLFIEAAGLTQNRIQKVRLLFDAGVLLQDQLKDDAKAGDMFAQVMAIDPEHEAAAERLVPMYLQASRFFELEPMLDMLVRRAHAAAVQASAGVGAGADDAGASADAIKARTARAADLESRLAFTAHKLSNVDKALGGYQAALALAPTSLPVLAGFADLQFERKDWAEVDRLYRALLAHHEAILPEKELLDVYVRLGRAAAELGDRDAALGFYEKASASSGQNRTALEGIAGLHADEGDFAALVLDKRALLGITDDAGKVRLLEEIGEIYLHQLHNLPQGIAAFQAALALEPGRRQTLNRLLELFTTARLWGQAAETLVRLADLEQAPEVRAKYIYTAALIRRDELNDVDGAVELLNRALEDAPTELKSFDAIERILTEAGSWKELARNYRKMIKRLPAQGFLETRLRLWNSLGQVSMQRLDDREMATTAFEVASSLEPDNIHRHELLAELYTQAGPDRVDKAIDEHQLLVAKNPDRLASYRALAKLYRQTGDIDKLWCVAATLSFLRKADPELQQLYEQHRPRELRAATRSFTDDIWAKVVHPDEDQFVAAVFMLLGHFVAATAAQQHQAVGLRRKERVDVARDDRAPLRLLRSVAQTLELPAPDVFFRDTEPQSLTLLNLQEKGVLTPAFVIGQGLAQRAGEPDVVFELGKRMAFLRPERFLRCAVPSVSALDIALRSALALVGAGIGPGVYNGEVDKLTDQLRRMVPKPIIEQMAVVGQRLLLARGEVIDMEAWMAATDLTAARVGFVLASELPAAARVISTEPATTSPLGAKQRLKDLLSYSVSEDYFAVRKFLGLDVM